MRKVWYIYLDSFNIGQASTGMIALLTIQARTGNKVDDSKLADILGNGYYQDGRYEAKLEPLKQ